MTNGEAIQHILFHAYGSNLSEKQNKALDMAIQALSKEEKAKEIIWNSGTRDGYKIMKLRKIYDP